MGKTEKIRLRFGPAVASKKGDPQELAGYLKQILEFSTAAIELSFTAIENIGNSITPETINLFNQFKYKSIHLPVVKQRNFISYPDTTIESELQKIDQLLAQVNVDTVLIHPDQVKDFLWVNRKFSDLLAYENMDYKKLKGKTVLDMVEIFKKSPQARWVCDVNHIYTNDPTMRLAQDFHKELSTRLTHYHLSGYDGFHGPICKTHEDIIFSGIIDPTKPIIDEGDIMQENLLLEEADYVYQKTATG